MHILKFFLEKQENSTKHYLEAFAHVMREIGSNEHRVIRKMQALKESIRCRRSVDERGKKVKLGSKEKKMPQLN